MEILFTLLVIVAIASVAFWLVAKIESSIVRLILQIGIVLIALKYILPLF